MALRQGKTPSRCGAVPPFCGPALSCLCGLPARGLTGRWTGGQEGPCRGGGESPLLCRGSPASASGALSWSPVSPRMSPHSAVWGGGEHPTHCPQPAASGGTVSTARPGAGPPQGRAGPSAARVWVQGPGPAAWKGPSPISLFTSMHTHTVSHTHAHLLPPPHPVLLGPPALFSRWVIRPSALRPPPHSSCFSGLCCCFYRVWGRRGLPGAAPSAMRPETPGPLCPQGPTTRRRPAGPEWAGTPGTGAGPLPSPGLSPLCLPEHAQRPGPRRLRLPPSAGRRPVCGRLRDEPHLLGGGEAHEGRGRGRGCGSGRGAPPGAPHHPRETAGPPAPQGSNPFGCNPWRTWRPGRPRSEGSPWSARSWRL